MYNLQNIKAIATKRNMSVKELTRRVKSTEQGFYKSLENNSMNIKTVAKIADVLEVSISELISDSRFNVGQNKSLVASPDAEYGKESELYKIMYQQQKEISDLKDEKMDLKLELERTKNASAPDRSALAV